MSAPDPQPTEPGGEPPPVEEPTPETGPEEEEDKEALSVSEALVTERAVFVLGPHSHHPVREMWLAGLRAA